jgi:N-acetyl-alpha-D-glucosaminyl L-malate synthase BshA
MVEVVRLHGVELIHVHYAVPNAVSAILARQIVAPQALPVVTTLHGTDITLVGNDPSYLETTRYGILESDAVTAVSQFLADATEEQLSIDRKVKDIEVIPNFIDPLRFERVRRGPGVRRWALSGEKTLVHVSNFRPVKRVDDVVEVHRRLVAKGLPVRLLMVGDGPERPRIERECRKRGGCDDISFLGNLSPVEEVLAGADIFILPSETESFGLAALESQACEVPVIASRVGGLPEAVQEGVTGFLLPLGDVEGMTEAAAELLENEGKRRDMGLAGRRRAIREFHVTRVMERYSQVYRKVIAE